MGHVFRGMERLATGWLGANRSVYVVVIALAAALLAAASPASARDRRLLELPPPDFTLYSSLREQQTRYFATNMAACDRIVTGASGAAVRRNAGPTRIFLVSPADWAEYFQPRDNVVASFPTVPELAMTLSCPPPAT